MSKAALLVIHCNASLILLLSHCTGMYSSISMCLDLLHLTVTPLPQPPPALACSLLLGVSSLLVRVGIHTSSTCPFTHSDTKWIANFDLYDILLGVWIWLKL